MVVDTRALDEAVRRFPLLLCACRESYPNGPARMEFEAVAVEMLRPSIIREYRLILTKEGVKR